MTKNKNLIRPLLLSVILLITISLLIGCNSTTGAQGPAGPEGQLGPEGLQGERGDAGAQGAIGPKGEKGDTGSTGPQGAVGPVGISGLEKVEAVSSTDNTDYKFESVDCPAGKLLVSGGALISSQSAPPATRPALTDSRPEMVGSELKRWSASGRETNPDSNSMETWTLTVYALCANVQ